MTLGRARWTVVIVGILLPYLVRVPRGWHLLSQYLDTSLAGALLLAGCNAIAWGAILLATLAYRHPVSVLAPALAGFGFLAYAHFGLDLASDAQAPIALVFIPIYALLPIAIGAIVGYVIDRILRRRDAR
jgi:hypothetical protein